MPVFGGRRSRLAAAVAVVAVVGTGCSSEDNSSTPPLDSPSGGPPSKSRSLILEQEGPEILAGKGAKPHDAQLSWSDFHTMRCDIDTPNPYEVAYRGWLDSDDPRVKFFVEFGPLANRPYHGDDTITVWAQNFGDVKAVNVKEPGLVVTAWDGGLAGERAFGEKLTTPWALRQQVLDDAGHGMLTLPETWSAKNLGSAGPTARVAFSLDFEIDGRTVTATGRMAFSRTRDPNADANLLDVKTLNQGHRVPIQDNKHICVR